MQHIESPQAFARFSAQLKQQQRIAFVPTMGNLHEGHLSLVRGAAAHSDAVTVSLFVNPTQFDQAADLDNYPRTLKDDLEMLAAEGVTAVFTPTASAMYTPQQISAVSVSGFAERYEGASRPGHFNGMATVVLKLLQLAQADWVMMGQKDYQQLLIVKQMVKDFFLATEVVAMPILREPSGLAMSSRNSRLSDHARANQAPVLRQQCLQLAQSLAEAPQRAHQTLLKTQSALAEVGFITDYLSWCNEDDLSCYADTNGMYNAPAQSTSGIVLTAAKLEDVRLIDNILL